MPDPEPRTLNAEPRVKRVLITAGPTWERIDAVRYIGNRSSGAMGLALATSAAKLGHEVTLLLGPVGRCELPKGVHVERFESAADLQELLNEHFRGHFRGPFRGRVCDLLIMAAAVADYRPSAVSAGKRERGGPWTLMLEPTPDLVAGCVKYKLTDQRIVAFALEEPHQLETRAKAKLARKGVDAIVANPLGTMQSGSVVGVLLWADGLVEHPPSAEPMDKAAFADWLMTRLV